MAAGKKTVVAVASGVFALAAGIGVAGLASADPTTTPTTSPSGAPSAGVDQPGPGHGGPGRRAHDRLDGDLAAKLAEKLGLTEDKVTTALKEIRAERTAQRATALKDRLAAAVKAGSLTQAEADAVQKAFDKGVISWR